RPAAPRGETERRLGEAGGAGDDLAGVCERREARGPRRVAGQMRDEELLCAPRPALVILMQELDFHARHVDTGRAFAPTTLARHAELEGTVKLVGFERVGSELPGQRETQRVRAAARDVPLVASGPIRRAHRAGVELPAMPVVVAHLDSGREAARGIAGFDV